MTDELTETPVVPPMDDAPDPTDVPTQYPLPELETVARECLAGRWSRGRRRNEKLTAAGYDPNEVQSEIDKILGR